MEVREPRSRLNNYTTPGQFNNGCGKGDTQRGRRAEEEDNWRPDTIEARRKPFL